MKSLILTVLYLAKDTLHRWMARLSSPLARVLVVFFLSLCALCALGGYVLAAKIVRDKIVRQGGDLVSVTLFSSGGEPCSLPMEKEISHALDADSCAVDVVGYARTGKGGTVPIISYDFERSASFFPLMARSGAPTLLEGKKGDGLPPGPSSVTISGVQQDVVVRHLPENHLLQRLFDRGALLVQPEQLPELLQDSRSPSMQQLILRVRNLDNAASVKRVEKYFHTLLRLEGVRGNVLSASRLLEEMDTLLSGQQRCRLAICLGITSIVGILLTALAGMEYRQNEYIYTLMKSFGIHPILLVGSFVVENTLIVGFSFALAIGTFMTFQEEAVSRLLRLGNYPLTLTEILPDIRIIAVTLLGCVLLSSLPILAAAHRDIGRVLK